jgi:carbon-monoxide dehydrogenase medium subunit
MKPAPFDYAAPDSLAAALELLQQFGEDAKPLAGGQSLVPAMNFRLAQPAVLVDLNRLDALQYIRPEAGGGLRVGAMTRQRAVERDQRVASLAPLLAEAMPVIAHPQIRNRGTIGGSMAHADPAAELPAVAVALDARFHLQSQRGERCLLADDFFQGIYTVDIQPDELLTEIAFPAWPARSGWSFREVARRHGDYALAGVAATVTLDAQARCQAARLVYISVGERPINAVGAAQLLIGNELNDESIAAAAEHAAAEEIDPSGNIHAGVAYQRHLVRVLTIQALREAGARALSAM